MTPLRNWKYFKGEELDDFLREFVSSVHTEEEVQYHYDHRNVVVRSVWGIDQRLFRKSRCPTKP